MLHHISLTVLYGWLVPHRFWRLKTSDEDTNDLHAVTSLANLNWCSLESINQSILLHHLIHLLRDLLPLHHSCLCVSLWTCYITAPCELSFYYYYPVPDTSGDGVLFSIDFFVCMYLCFFLCFFVSRITRKWLDRFAWNFQGRCGVTMERPGYIFGQFRETAWCRDAQHGDLVCCAFAPQLVIITIMMVKNIITFHFVQYESTESTES